MGCYYFWKANQLNMLSLVYFFYLFLLYLITPGSAVYQINTADLVVQVTVLTQQIWLCR
ncbi:hypothetical protein E5S67_03384 [Microcoleus sp. IPMA8]|uniref:Uncharacterized protein n=1 Tax=Microcoleus asticus IPMA8 TaxID=2563858 RepID=A0ABX2CZ25_9CYAN|nr:hypothetical protein [Microcoleus asticus IPMA8]